MKLITKEIEKRLLAANEQRDGGDESPIIIKLFNPCGAQTWYITSGEKVPADETMDGREDWFLFGYCDLGDAQFAELGYVSLNELADLRFPRFGLRIERDLYYGDKHTLGEVRSKPEERARA